jgi:hypothetical protein
MEGMKFTMGIALVCLGFSISVLSAERNLFVIQVGKSAIKSEDFDFLCLIPAATYINMGKPAVMAIENVSKVTSDIYLKDYLLRFKAPSAYTVNFTHTGPTFVCESKEPFNY